MLALKNKPANHRIRCGLFLRHFLVPGEAAVNELQANRIKRSLERGSFSTVQTRKATTDIMGSKTMSNWY